MHTYSLLYAYKHTDQRLKNKYDLLRCPHISPIGSRDGDIRDDGGGSDAGMIDYEKLIIR